MSIGDKVLVAIAVLSVLGVIGGVIWLWVRNAESNADQMIKGD